MFSWYIFTLLIHHPRLLTGAGLTQHSAFTQTNSYNQLLNINETTDSAQLREHRDPTRASSVLAKQGNIN